MLKSNIKKISIALAFTVLFRNNLLVKAKNKNTENLNTYVIEQTVLDKKQNLEKNLDKNNNEQNIKQNAEKKVIKKEDFQSYEEALDFFGAKGTITWGNNLKEEIPEPKYINEVFNWNGKDWKHVLAHCGWHQSEIIWKDSENNYLVPSGIYMHGM